VDRLSRIVLSLFGLGLLPWFPGTWGTAGTAILVFLIPGGTLWPISIAVLAVVSSILTLRLTPGVERSSGKKDPGFIVLDEVAGYCVTVAALDKPDWWWLFAGFLLFRLTDIVKPWPAGGLQRLRGGIGVLVDDLVAGVYAFALLALLKALSG
jgi:phosphatidylglycerophosphatase A